MKKFLLTLAIVTACVAGAQVNFIYYGNGPVVTFSITQRGSFYEMVKWDFGDGTIDYNSANLISHTYTATGMYSVCVIGMPMPITPPDTACKMVNVTGIVSVDENKKQQFVTLSPNPGTGEFTLNLADACDLVVTDLFGRIVFKQRLVPGRQNINLKDAAAGTYYARITGDYSMQAVKIIVSR